MSNAASIQRFDTAVIGLGLIGCAALRHAALIGGAGRPTIGIGPAEPVDLASHPGVFSSHYDSGRITRFVDPTFEWALLARRAIEQYPTIESAGGIGFHHPVGVVYASRSDSTIEEAARVIERLGVPTCRTEINDDPRLHFEPGTTLFIEGAPAGFIDPRRMIAAQLAAARAAGAVVVRSIADAVRRVGGGWEIDIAGHDTVRAERVVIAAGPHSDELTGLPLRPLLDVRPESVLQAVIDEKEQERLAGLPSVLSPEDEPFDDFYLVPAARYPDGTTRLKIGATLAEPRFLHSRAERTAWMRSDNHLQDLDPLRNMMLRLLPGLRVERWETKPCLITDTPTNLPYVDHIAEGMVLAAGCNGYAAKSSDAIGALAVGLAIDGTWRDAELGAARFRLIERV